MKKLISVSMMFLVFMVTACVSEQQRSAGSNPLGNVFELPCQLYDDDNYFAAVGIAKGSIDQKVELQKTALANAQDICRQNAKHEYWNWDQEKVSWAIGLGKLPFQVWAEEEGNKIIDKLVNNAQAKCVKYSGVLEDGKIEVYVGIKISKREVAEKIVNELVFTIEEKERIDFQKISEEEKAHLDFQANEAEYRKRMEERFNEFKEEKAENEKVEDASKLTEEEKDQLIFREAEFRKAMEERLKEFDKVREKNPENTKNEQKVLSLCASEPHQALGESWELPCQMYDDDDYFVATGIAKESMDQKGKLQEHALFDAKQIVQRKIRSAYRWMSEIAWKLIDSNSKIIDKIHQAGDSVIGTATKNAQAKCVKYSGGMADGMIESYVGIQISRREIAEKMLKAIKKVLIEDQRMIEINEYDFGNQVRERELRNAVEINEYYFRNQVRERELKNKVEE